MRDAMELIRWVAGVLVAVLIVVEVVLAFISRKSKTEPEKPKWLPRRRKR
jgi:hypothetical protein